MPFGRGTLAVGILLTTTATVAAVVSLLIERDLVQLALPAAVMVPVLVGLFLRSRRVPALDHEVVTQVAVSISIYGVVWVAASGYLIAGIAGHSIATSRTAALHACSVGLLLSFSLILVRSALKSRQRYYCLGLALSTLLAGMLLPILDWHFSYPVAHGLMAMGYLAGVAIQSAQLREAVGSHATD
ncbi:hypothetical protein ACYOEI_05325 [Singulisphaera rosea]